MNGQCGAPGCDQAKVNGSHCVMHRNRLKRLGSYELSAKPPKLCSVDGCESPSRTNQMCPKHHTRLKRTGTADLRTKVRRADVTYRAAHNRVSALFGNANRYDCIDCGSQASQWSFVGGVGPELVERGMRYSPEPSAYRPRCRDCHALFDAGVRRLAEYQREQEMTA